MIRYFTRRILYSLFLLASVSILSFALVDLAPGDFFESLRLNPRIAVSTIDALRSQRGLDQPLLIRYFRWVRSIVSGEWGFSLPITALQHPFSGFAPETRCCSQERLHFLRG